MFWYFDSVFIILDGVEFGWKIGVEIIDWVFGAHIGATKHGFFLVFHNALKHILQTFIVIMYIM